MKLKALKTRVIVKPDEEKSVSEGGILLTDSMKERPKRGTIVSVGEDITSIKVGDRVCYGKYIGTEVEDYLIMSVDDLLAVLENE